MTTQSCAVIILAAGYSSRMGRFKPLIKLGGRTITERLILLYQSYNIPSFVVTGWKKEELLAATAVSPDQFVDNPDFADGMFSSIRAGLKAVREKSYESVFIQPVDVPLVRSNTLQQLLPALETHPGKIIYPCFNRRRGHPSLIPLSLASAVLDWAGEGGLRGFLQIHEEIAEEVSLPDSNILFDIDTPSDLPELEARFRTLNTPSHAECDYILNALLSVPPRVQRHCEAVAELASEIGRALQECGAVLNLELIQAAAMLHDICKGQPRHEATAGQKLRDMGFTEIAEIVERHTELGDAKTTSLETKVVFLADKFVLEDQRRNLAERYAAGRTKFGSSAEALNAIDRRQNEAFQVKADMELVLGRRLETLIFKENNTINTKP